MKAKSALKAAAVTAVACLSISALWAGSSPSGRIIGTWTCRSGHLTLQETFSPNGTYTVKNVTVSGISSIPTTSISVTGRYTVVTAISKTGSSTKYFLSTKITQEAVNGKTISIERLPQLPSQMITFSGDGKIMSAVDNINNQVNTNKQLWHRQ